MKKRWLLNLLLLVVVAGLVAFLYLRPKSSESEQPNYALSQLKLADINVVVVEFPTKAPVSFEKVDGYWRMTAPYKTRADALSVQRILAIIAATSTDKFPSTDLAKYGLDKPQIRVKLTGNQVNATFIYGTYNPINDNQYVAYNDSVYLLSGVYSESARTQPIEMVDKNILSKTEGKAVTGFDFSRLEQWQASHLHVNLDQGKWITNIDNAKPVQNDMNEWLAYSWQQNPASSVEIYTPDPHAVYPSFEVKLKDGKKIHFDKISEAPELLLARPDEGLIFHYSNDVGFTMLNPPLNIQKK